MRAFNPPIGGGGQAEFIENMVHPWRGIQLILACMPIRYQSFKAKALGCEVACKIIRRSQKYRARAYQARIVWAETRGVSAYFCARPAWRYRIGACARRPRGWGIRESLDFRRLERLLSGAPDAACGIGRRRSLSRAKINAALLGRYRYQKQFSRNAAKKKNKWKHFARREAWAMSVREKPYEIGHAKSQGRVPRAES